MTVSDSDMRCRLLLKVFQMPAVQTMVSRKSSVTNAFVGSLIPVIMPTIEEIDQALVILGMEPGNVRCAYCGDGATEWDHLRPLVKDLRPTGYISEIANLVPSCGKCNQSKGNKYWRDWMLSKAPRAPTGRGISDVEQRIERLDRYEQWKPPTKVDFAAIVGAEEWAAYWKLWEVLITDMRKSQEVAEALRQRVLLALKQR